jgi:hypothetical protein
MPFPLAAACLGATIPLDELVRRKVGFSVVTFHH